MLAAAPVTNLKVSSEVEEEEEEEVEEVEVVVEVDR